jgi:hypothetical protein
LPDRVCSHACQEADCFIWVSYTRK